MKWSNLKSNTCPKCGSLLEKVGIKYYGCMKRNEDKTGCPFVIKVERFNELVQNMYQNPRAQFNTADNMQALNNLGHDEVKEDFSDSPFLDY
jgi:hypothetical protein